MSTSNIPPCADIAAMLARLSYTQVGGLAALSGVSLHTLLKIRAGQTVNPGIETVRAFVPHIAKARKR